MLYATTSRKPSVCTKRLCRLLCSLLPASSYENRGKKSIEDVVERARSLGCSRILIFSEEHGNPRSIRAINTNGEWSWHPVEILMRKIEIGEKAGMPKLIRATGKNSGLFSELFMIGDSEGGVPALLKAGENKLEFEYAKKTPLSFEFEVVRHEEAEM